MKRHLLLASLCCMVMAAKADYKDYFRVQTPDGTRIENGSVVLCVNPSVVNGGFFNECYDYSKELDVKNLSMETQTFSSILSWGSYPTKDEYIAHYEEADPETYALTWGHSKMCSTQGRCYGDNIPENLGKGEIEVTGRQADGGFIYQLLRTPTDLVSEYRITLYADNHPEDLFECTIVYAPNEEAAREFLEASADNTYEFSSVKFISATPADGSFIQPLQTDFQLEFTGPVKIVDDKSLFYGKDGLPEQFEAIVPLNTEGEYSDKWLAILPEDYITDNDLQELELEIAAKDEDGKVVQGNYGVKEESVIVLKYLLAPPVFEDFTVVPASESVMNEISSIEIFSESYSISINSEMEGAKIDVFTPTGKFITDILFDNIKIEQSDVTKAILTLSEPITEDGNYIIRIPEGLFTFSSDSESYMMPTTVLRYEISNQTDVTTIDITPAQGEVKELTGFTINIPWLTPSWQTDGYYQPLKGTLTLPDGNIVDILQADFIEVLSDPDDFWSDILGQSYEFDTPFTAPGNYVLNIPARMFSIGEEGSQYNPEWTVVWTIGTTGIDDIVTNSDRVDVFTITGIQVVNNGTASDLNRLPEGLYIVNGKKVFIGK